MGVWLDEHAQFYLSNFMPQKALTIKSFRQHQPPLDYILSLFSGTLFGQTPLSLKGHSLLFGFLFLLGLPFSLKRVSKSTLIQWTPSFVFCMISPLLAYSLEARPIMLTVFISSLSFSFLVQYLKEGKDYHWLLISQVLFIQCTGAQPQIFILSSVLFFFFILFKSGEFQRGKLLFISGVISFIATLPITGMFIKATIETRKFKEELGLRTLTSGNFWDGLFQFFQEDRIFLLSFIVIGLFGTFLKKSKIDRGVILFPFFFLLFFYLIFKLLIAWTFMPRYFYSFFGAFGFSFGLSLGFIWEELEFRPKVRKLFLIFGSCLLIYGSYFNLSRPLQDSITTVRHPDWRSALHYLNKNVREGDFVQPLSFDNYGLVRRNIIVGVPYYSNETVEKTLLRPKIISQWEINPSLFVDEKRDYLFEPKAKAGDIYLVFNLENANPVYIDFLALKAKEVKDFRLLKVLRFKGSESLYSTVREIYSSLIEKFPNEVEMLAVYESLMELELSFSQDKDLFLRLFSNYSNLRMPNPQERQNYFLKRAKERGFFVTKP